MRTSRLAGLAALSVALLASATLADPPNDSRFAIPIFRHSPAAASRMWIFNRGSQDIDVEVLVSGRDITQGKDIPEPVAVALGTVGAGLTRVFTSSNIIERSGEEFSIEYTYEFSLRMTLSGPNVFVRTAVKVLGLSIPQTVVKSYAITSPPSTPGIGSRFTIPLMPHKQGAPGYFWIFNGGAEDTAADASIAGRNTTLDEDITEPVLVQLGVIPKHSNRSFTTQYLILNSGGKLSLEYEYDFSLTIDAGNKDVQVIAVGEAGTGRASLSVDKKFVRGPEE